jgi:hypothetical protein
VTTVAATLVRWWIRLKCRWGAHTSIAMGVGNPNPDTGAMNIYAECIYCQRQRFTVVQWKAQEPCSDVATTPQG